MASGSSIQRYLTAGVEIVASISDLIRKKISPSLKVGQKAPDFELSTLKGERNVRLSSFRGKRPVVLIFGSYT